MKKEILMPALFIGHGSPMNAITLNRFSLSWYQLGQQLPKPRAILVISSHYITHGMTSITAMDRPKTIHDFVGFPNELVELEYSAKGSPFMASHIVKSLEEFTPIYEDYTDWGLDHGAWSILSHMYPDADIPVLELSLDISKPPAFHHEFGRALSELRRQGILLIGTGNVVHNLRQLKWEIDQSPYTWAENFNQFVLDNLDSHAFTENHPLVNFQSHPDALLAHPTLEHYLPMLYILGAWTGREKLQLFNNTILQGSLSMLSFMVGDEELNLSLEAKNIQGAAYGTYELPSRLELDFFEEAPHNQTNDSNLVIGSDVPTLNNSLAVTDSNDFVPSVDNKNGNSVSEHLLRKNIGHKSNQHHPSEKKHGFLRQKISSVAKKLVRNRG